MEESTDQTILAILGHKAIVLAETLYSPHPDSAIPTVKHGGGRDHDTVMLLICRNCEPGKG